MGESDKKKIRVLSCEKKKLSMTSNSTKTM